MTKLLPCPFCGTEMALRGDYTHEAAWNFYTHADREERDDCILSQYEIPCQQDMATPVRTLAEAWNRRVAYFTDDQLLVAVQAMDVPDRIQGFSSPRDRNRNTWGPPHWVLDTHRPRGEQELWRGDSHDDMMDRCEIERFRIGLSALYIHKQT
jgi:hypothetical protein